MPPKSERSSRISFRRFAIGGLLERCGTFGDVTLVTETSGLHALGGVTSIGVSFSGNHVNIKIPFCSSGGILVRHSSSPPGSIHKLVFMGSTPMLLVRESSNLIGRLRFFTITTFFEIV